MVATILGLFWANQNVVIEAAMFRRCHPSAPLLPLPAGAHACRLLEATPTIAVLFLVLSPKADTHFTVPHMVEG